MTVTQVAYIAVQQTETIAGDMVAVLEGYLKIVTHAGIWELKIPITLDPAWSVRFEPV
jgi:hypothetical protein